MKWKKKHFPFNIGVPKIESLCVEKREAVIKLTIDFTRTAIRD